MSRLSVYISTLVEVTMTGNRKVLCKLCYREMRSDNLTRHMKQHSKRNESTPVTNNYNTTHGVSTERKDAENKIKDEELKMYLIKIGNEYKRKLALGKQIYKMVGEGIAPYQALPSEMKEAVDAYMVNQEDF